MSINLVELNLPSTAHYGPCRAIISPVGANLFSWQVAGRELIDGFIDHTDQLALDGYRSAVMAPWSNRLKDGKYSFNNNIYYVPDGAPFGFSLNAAAGLAAQATNAGSGELMEADMAAVGQENDLLPRQLLGLHGLVFTAPWRVVTHQSSRVEFAFDMPASPAYPAALRLFASYELLDTASGIRLEFSLQATNVSAVAVPLALGWHPYFKLAPLAELNLKVPAMTSINIDENGIPLPGQAAFTQLESPYCLQSLQDQIIDQAFTALIPDSDGLVRTVLADQAGASITVEQWHPNLPGNAPLLGQGIVHIYTADTMKRSRRQCVAIEPCQFMTDAFNRPHLQAALLTQPGETRRIDTAVIFTAGNL